MAESQTQAVETGVEGDYPRLRAGIDRRRNADGQLVLSDPRASAYMGLRKSEEPLLELMGGESSLDDVVRAGMALTPPLRPMAVLGCLRRLYREDMLDGLERTGARLFGSQPTGSPLAALLRRSTNLRLNIPGLQALSSPGAVLPTAIWTPLFWLGVVATVSALVFAGVQGRLQLVLGLFPRSAPALTLVTYLYVLACCVLSFRGLLRGLALRSNGIAVYGAGLRVVWGIAHFDIDDRERRAAHRDGRLAAALAGLTPLFLAAGAGAWLAATTGNLASRLVSAVSIAALIINLAPYARTDGREVAGILSLMPHLRRRSWSYLKKHAFQVRRKTPENTQDMTFSWAATAWIAHGLIVVYLLGGHWMAGLSHLFIEILSGRGTEHAPPWLMAIGGAVGVVLVLILAVLVLWFVTLALTFLGHLAPSKTSATRGQQLGDEAAEFIDAVRGIPFLSTMPDDAISRLASQLKRETYRPGEAIIRQGEPGDRFCFVEHGQCAVAIADASGLEHQVATLATGDFFGEIALVQDIERTATVRATGDVRILSLSRDVFLAMAEEVDTPTEEVLSQVRNAAFVRGHRFFATLSPTQLRQVLSRLKERNLPSNEIVVTQGESGDSLFLIREGRCVVDHESEDGETHRLATLSGGEHFGEIALMADGVRTATVRTDTDAVLLEVPDDVFKDVLLRNFEAVSQLDRGCSDRLDLLEVL
jgi:CRP-like cAMP-binding protein